MGSGLREEQFVRKRLRRYWQALALSFALGSAYWTFAIPQSERSNTTCQPSAGGPGLRVRVGISYDFEESVALSSILDSISLNPALEFVCGRGDVAPQIEQEVQEMKIGERRCLTLDSSNPLFGFYDERRRISVPASEFSTAEIGTVVSLEGYGAGMGLVLERDAQTLLVDQNHPLAGKSVNVTLTLLRCEKVPPRDVRVMPLVGGDGQTFPAYGDWLTLNYELRLAGSTRIIDSTDVGPLEYHLGFDQARLVPGFEIGVQQMSLGEVASIHVPSQLAYGSKGSDKAIPANADLVYKVALLGIRSVASCEKLSHVLFDPPSGAVKLCDLDHGRSLDSPLRAYSPEEAKQRDSSNREKSRLRYKSPELILRKEEYGAAVDIWATGCLLAEAVLSTPLFDSNEEIEHLFLIFRLLGTPGPGHWPEALRCRNFSPRFPVYKPVDLGAVTRATARAAVGDCSEVKQLTQEMEHREDVLQKICCVAKKLQARGMALFASLLRLDPAQRSTAEQALQTTFFTALSEPDTPSRRRWRTDDGIEPGDVEGRRVRQKSQQSQESPSDMSGPSQVSWKWSQDIPCSQQEMATPGTAVAQTLARCQLFTQSSQGSPVSNRRVCGAMSGDTLWPPLWAEMVRQDTMCRPSVSRLPSRTVLQWQQEARSRRLTVLASAITVGALLSLHTSASTAAQAFANTASPVAAAMNYFTQLILVLTPGVAVSGGAYILAKRRDSPPKPMWVISAALLAMLALSAPLVLPGRSDTQVVEEIQLRSGEERLMPNGQVQLVSDPRPGNGPAEEGWQQALWTEMAQAIQSGEEQIVMVFSRPGCPWCEKLHPVLERAVKRRADALASAGVDDAEGPTLLHKPLRIFIYDASEFGPVMRRFGVEGFPTLYFFGEPGSRPTVVPGYLSDEDFDKVAKAAAEAPIEPPPRERKRGASCCKMCTCAQTTPGAEDMDLLLRLGTEMQLMDQTLHLAAALLHDQLSDPDPTLRIKPTLATLACLKLADAMLEKSHEYFMRDRSGDIRDACNGSWSKEDIIEAEKVVFRRQSTLHRPTADWFLHTCLHIWRQEAAVHSSIGDRCCRDVNCLAKFINMCCLYDNEMQAQPSSLRAQVSIMLAVHCVSTDGSQGPTSEKAFQAWRLVRSKTCGSNTRDLVLPVFARICEIVTSHCSRLLGQLQGDPQAAVPAEKRYPAAARRIPKEFPLALADELLPIWPESCSTPVRHVRHTPSQVGFQWTWAEAGPCGKVPAPRAGSQRGASPHLPCASIAAMAATAVHGLRGFRGRHHGKKSVMALEDESENEREAPSGLQTALRQEWHEFWFGDYWSEEVPVTVGPLTVVGVIALLYGIEYFLAQTILGTVGALILLAAVIFSSTYNPQPLEWYIVVHLCCTMRPKTAWSQGAPPSLLRPPFSLGDIPASKAAPRPKLSDAWASRTRQGEEENHASVPDSIADDGGPVPGTPGGSCSTDDIEEQNRGGRWERTRRSSSGAGRASEAVKIDFTDSWSTLLRNLLREEDCKPEDCRVFNRHGELIPVFFDKDFVPMQRDFPLHVTFRKETKSDWRVSESDEAIKTATSATSLISEEQEEVRRAASSVASAETDDEVPIHLQVVAKSLRHWLAEMKLQHLESSVLRWCDEMGACSVQEVVDCLEYLIAALDLQKSDAKRLCSEASRAMRKLKTPGAVGLRKEQKVLSTSSTTLAQELPGLTPFTRTRQGLKKKMMKDRQRQLASTMSEGSITDGLQRKPTTDDFSSVEAAKEKLALQLKEEEEKQKDAAITALNAALSKKCLDDLGAAIQMMEAVGLDSHELVATAKRDQEMLSRRHLQLCEESVCALQAALEAPRDDRFGQAIREALQNASFACQVQGGQRVCKEAQNAVRVWDEVRMALQIAVRNGCPDAMRLCILEAQAAGFSQLSLLAEAERLVQEAA
eukprot:s1437_g3.t2